MLEKSLTYDYHNFQVSQQKVTGFYQITCDKCGLQQDDLYPLVPPSPPISSCPQFLMFSCCQGKGTATWDPVIAAWKCKDCNTPQSNDPNYIGNGFKQSPYEPKKSGTGQCTCGSTKTYGVGATHADYCDIK